jgi:acyl transferase domain-containing protein/thioester reductase-like protein/acyl carrier protein
VFIGVCKIIVSMKDTTSGAGLDNSPFDATVFLFGSYTGAMTEEAIGKLVRPILDGPDRSWILATTADLPKYLEAIEKKIPAVAQYIAGHKQLSDLDGWLRHGTALWKEDGPLPNIIISPLLVLTQIAQYWRYLEHQVAQTGEVASDVQAHTLASSATKVEALGYCGGLLAAFAVASAHDRAEFERYSAVAVRLAMVLGAVADARERLDVARGKGGSLSLAMAWTGSRQGDEVRQIVDSFGGDAYVAVRADAGRATVTASERNIPTLAERLHSAGAIVAETGVRGRLHAPDAEQRAFGEAVVEVCYAMEGLQYAAPDKLAMPSYSNCEADGGRPIAAGRKSTTEAVVRSVMVQQCDWYGTFSAVATANGRGLKKKLVMIGERCVPPSMMRTALGRQVVYVEDLDLTITPAPPSSSLAPSASSVATNTPASSAFPSASSASSVVASGTSWKESSRPPLAPQNASHDESIAVIGMAIKAPNADDLAEFAEMLKTGKSQHELITPDRMMFDMLFRNAPDVEKDRYYCNFMRDTDAFDHKFFKRSPREAVSMDPQARLSLQCAYQAIEQSGYFAETQPRDKRARNWKNHVGVYVGCCGSDYEHNTGHHEPNAFTGTGGFRSFVSGRISHYFGWTGPNMLFDTACSSAAVALHTACRSILNGESSAALAGGANIMTGIQWFQDMAAGSFLSPTGQCKPFDDNADGYCRGEAIGFVYLKKMSDAVRDGNHVWAEIKSSLVYQNQNTTPLFVPNSPSLSQLFEDVLAKANVTPRDISLVEAHGTGTPVGDPAEYESVRMALGGPSSGRAQKLLLGSVKGHTGHAEGASGLVALIKVVMMMQQNFIPPQASFNKLNHLIDMRPDDMIEVPTTLRPWDNEYKLALINNYGASGSNCSFIVGQGSKPAPRPKVIGENDQFPFWISGFDARAVSAYSAKLASYCQSLPKQPGTLSDISYALARHSNRGLSQGYVFSCRTVQELEAKLAQAASNPDMNAAAAAAVGIKPVKAARPVIMCFGGQVSLSVGLDRNLYDRVAVFRQHLDECDSIVTSLGLASIYPGIFSREPERDTVKLQTMLFAMQYACAKSWLDCGLENQVAAVVGHSFGEITALCISGALSLRDTVSLVAARSRLVRDSWGPDSGAMLVVEADEKLVQELLVEANRTPASDGLASIACYNGPRSFTLAGSTVAVDCVQKALASSAKFSAIKSKRLSVSNAFHSALVEKLVGDLGQVGKSLVFREPVIPIERTTQEGSDTLDWTFVHSHMRQPVFFHHALQRLVKKYPQAIFLEAGSNSTITVMASRALQGSAQAGQDHHFQAVSLTNTDNGFKGLTDVTTDLWKQGMRVTFWAHHREQMPEYAPLLLPPYQFSKGPSYRHWMKMKSPHEAVQKAAQALVEKNGLQLQQAPAAHVEKPLNLFDFVGWLTDQTKKRARFRINTESDKYKMLALSHVVAQTAPVCPNTLLCDVAIQALFGIQPEWKVDETNPVVRDLISTTPICANSSRALYVEFSALNNKLTQWRAHFFSLEKGAAIEQPQTHVEACVDMRPATEAAHRQEFTRFGRLVSHVRCRELFDLSLGDEGVEVLQGRQLYRTLAPDVEYGDIYRGVRYVVGRGDECVADVKLDRHHRQSEGWLDVPLAESFLQVGGIWLNAMTDRQPEKMYVAAGFEVAMRSPKLTATDRAGAEKWHVYARFTAQDEVAADYTADLFVFNAVTAALSEVILGVKYQCLAKAAVAEMLDGKTEKDLVVRDSAPVAVTSTSVSLSATVVNTTLAEPERKSKRANKQKQQPEKKEVSIEVEIETKPGQRDMRDEVRNLVVSISGVEADELDLDTEMADVGIDSLMGMELAREVERAFGCTLDHAKQLEATSLRKFIALVENAMFGTETKIPRGSVVKERTVKEKIVEKVKKAPKAPKAPEPKKTTAGHRSMFKDVQDLVVSVSGIEADDLGLDTEMVDVGIDSLMGMELAREIERAFGCTLDHAKQLEATTLRKFVALVEEAMFGADVPRASAVDDVESLDDEDSLDDSLVDVGEDLDTSSDEDSDEAQPPPPPPRTMTTTAPATAPATSKLSLSPSMVLDSFAEIKMAADQLLVEYDINGTEKTVMAGNNRLCTALIVEALDELGGNLGTAKPGQPIDPISFIPKQKRLMQWIWEFLERDARLVDIDAATGKPIRTHMTVPAKSSDAILEEQIKLYPKFATPSRLASFAGKKLAGVLSGKTDGLRMLFGSPEGRKLMEAHECDQPWNLMHYTQIRDTIKGIAERGRLSAQPETLKVLEMGAGVGAITQVLAPFLASLGIPVEFTVTDPSSTLVAGARRRWGEQYPFMRFAVHDLEKAPAAKLRDQHILVGSAVHATRNLLDTLTHMHESLRPDGALLMLEMTEGVPFANLVFGSLERWWIFEDGRTGALVSAEHWERKLHAAGFGHVDWTDGDLPEHAYHKVIVALASGAQGTRLPKPAPAPTFTLGVGDIPARTATAEALVAKHSAGWATPALQAKHAKLEKSGNTNKAPKRGDVVLVTGGTGSLGCHIVQSLAENPTVAQVICLNRPSAIAADKRQHDALRMRGITLTPGARAKVRALAGDMAQPSLGLPPYEHVGLSEQVTHVVHNAWCMSGTRPLSAFTSSLQAMRNLLDLARDVAIRNDHRRLGFLFVSSIGAVGCSPGPRVLEERLPLAVSLPNGYGEAKWVCERMLDATLHKFPLLFRAAVVRPGQISGSSTSGYWNPDEHFPFMVKSAQSLRVWPDLSGTLLWTPADHCGSIVADLALNPAAEGPVYHMDNPVGQPWSAVNPVMARLLGVPADGIVPFREWIKRVRTSPLVPETENPAMRAGMVDFLEKNFENMSCGGLVLDTKRAEEHSVTMANEGPVSDEVIGRYVEAWKKMGLLN